MLCRWQSPDGAHTVVLGCATVESLRGRVLEAFLSLPKRGFEVGGLLLGRMPAADGGEMHIEAFEEVPCEYRYGPGYQLSPDDRLRMVEMVERRRPEGSLEVVGFYRSFTRRSAVLDDGERETFRTLFPRRDFGILLLQPQTPTQCSGNFLFSTRGELATESSYPWFDFSVGELESKPETAVEEAVDRPVAVAPAEPEPVPEAPSVADRVEASLEPDLHIPLLPLPVPVEPMEAVMLPAETSPKVAAREEPAAPPVRAEPVPVIPVQPSPVAPEEPVMPAGPAPEPPVVPERMEFPAPSFTFEPRGYEDEPDAGGGRRIWMPLLACMVLAIGSVGLYEWSKSGSRPRYVDLKMDAHQAPGEIRLSWDKTAAEVVLASHGTLGVTDGTARKDVALSAADVRSGQYLYKPQNSTLTFQLEVWATSGKPVADSLHIVNAPVGTEAAAATPPAPASPPPPAPVAPPHKGEASRTSAPSPSTAAVATEAVPIERVQPTVSEGIRSRVESRLEVPVEVRISETGRVTDASWHGDGDTVYRYLAGEAVKAARMWRFVPAKAKDGTPVPSRKRLEFVFTPPGN